MRYVALAAVEADETIDDLIHDRLDKMWGLEPKALGKFLDA
ncbi:hypothetical protein [Desulfopila aestuarii]|nr:hypothetical protein [Desulfopila aestuarii]